MARSLEEYLDDIKQEGLSLDHREKVVCDAFREAIKEHGRYPARKMLAENLGNLLRQEEAVDIYSESTPGCDKHFELKKQFDDGERIVIEGIGFYNPKAINTENPLQNSTAANTFFNTITASYIPLNIANKFTDNEIIKKLSAGVMPMGIALKLFTKAFKEWNKENRDYNKVARYTLAGVGGVAISTGVTFVNGPLKKYILNPMMAAYSGMATGIKDRFTKRGLSLHEQLPPLGTIRNDLREQAQRYDGVLAAHDEDIYAIKRDYIPDLVRDVNVFLKHHLKSVKPRDIDIEFDIAVAPLNTIVDDSVSLGSRSTETVEFSYFHVNGLSAPEVAYSYITSAIFIDREQNPGMIRLRGDEVLEELAVYHSDRGFDIMLEQTRLETVAYAYADVRRAELDDTMEKDEILGEISAELLLLGIDEEIIGTIREKLYPDIIGEAMAVFQKWTGNTDVYGYLTHYTLMKAEGLF